MKDKYIKPGGIFDKMLNNMKPKATDKLDSPAGDRLAILAVELGLAGGEVLRDEFDFTEAQVTLWLDKMLDKAKANRMGSLAQLAVEQIDNAEHNKRT